MKTYERTHSWIKFTIDLSRAGAKLWLLLGEAVSKVEHIAGVPLRPLTAMMLHQMYLAKGAASTTAIEGNSLTEKEVLEHLQGRLKLPPSKEYLVQEIDNITEAFNSIGKMIRNNDFLLSPEKICDLNRMVLKNLKLEDGVVAGEIREHSVVVGKVYRGAPAEDCKYLLDKLCKWLEGSDFKSPDANLKIVYAIIKAIVAHLYLEWIHPFGDGNGRTGRLIEFQILLSAGIPTPAAHLLSNHYNQTRADYYRQLDMASKSGGNILGFLEYSIQGFVDGLKEQIKIIRNQQWDVAWQNYIHQLFKDKLSSADLRCRHLILDLSAHDGYVLVPKLIELTPRLAKAYATKSMRTLHRDIEQLLKMELLERSPEGVRAKKELILAFLPWRNESNK